MLSEINIAPRILTNFTGVMPSQFKKDLDSYLKTRSPVTFLSELRSNLQVGGASLGPWKHLQQSDTALDQVTFFTFWPSDFGFLCLCVLEEVSCLDVCEMLKVYCEYIGCVWAHIKLFVCLACLCFVSVA